jgi:hypothetical protein
LIMPTRSRRNLTAPEVPARDRRFRAEMFLPEICNSPAIH